MTQYQLAKLVEWAGKLRTRKKLQKVVFLLQQVGCPLENNYRLHHFGPYSADVARMTDEMTLLDILTEEEVSHDLGRQFNYSLSESARESIKKLEQTESGQSALQTLTPFEGLAKSLLNEDLKELEFAATIVYFLRRRENWDAAVEKTCQFKQQTAGSSLMRKAETLARKLCKTGENDGPKDLS